MRAQAQVIGAAVRGHDQAGFEAHVHRLDDEVLNLGRAAAGDGRFDRPPGRVAQVDRVDLFAGLQGHVAHLEHRATMLGCCAPYTNLMAPPEPATGLMPVADPASHRLAMASAARS
jgi:hypothetical protein